jgi:hypothetical protein
MTTLARKYLLGYEEEDSSSMLPAPIQPGTQQGIMLCTNQIYTMRYNGKKNLAKMEDKEALHQKTSTVQ